MVNLPIEDTHGNLQLDEPVPALCSQEPEPSDVSDVAILLPCHRQ